MVGHWWQLSWGLRSCWKAYVAEWIGYAGDRRPMKLVVCGRGAPVGGGCCTWVGSTVGGGPEGGAAIGCAGAEDVDRARCLVDAGTSSMAGSVLYSSCGGESEF